jgi:ATP-dependent helicase YprA (DUF1998 family)
MTISNLSGVQHQAQRKRTVKEIRHHTKKITGKRPCWFQLKVALAVYEGKDVVACAPTEAGKTLSFWIPLLMALEDGLDPMVIIVTSIRKAKCGLTCKDETASCCSGWPKCEG